MFSHHTLPNALKLQSFLPISSPSIPPYRLIHPVPIPTHIQSPRTIYSINHYQEDVRILFRDLLVTEGCRKIMIFLTTNNLREQTQMAMENLKTTSTSSAMRET